MTLYDIEKGKEYIVEKSTFKQPIKRRLEAMGLIEGTRIRKINQGLDGSVIFATRGIRMAIGKDIADEILVRETRESDYRAEKFACTRRKRKRQQGQKRQKRGRVSDIRKVNQYEW